MKKDIQGIRYANVWLGDDGEQWIGELHFSRKMCFVIVSSHFARRIGILKITFK